MSTEPPTPSFRAQWARRLVREKLSKQLSYQTRVTDGKFASVMPELGAVPISPLHLPPEVKPLPEAKFAPGTKVCIVGAGAAGLYIAMILDSLAIPNLSYDILEADKRIGGRMFTHYFSKTPHDYYDIGAMRFPQIPIMDRTFDLFKRTGVPLVPYFLDPSTGAINNPSMYNDYLTNSGDSSGDPKPASAEVIDTDPYHVSVSNGGSVPDETVTLGTKILDNVFGEYKALMKENFEKGFKKLLEQDLFSTREYLKTGGKDGAGKKYDFFSIQWLETLNTSSGLFDQAFTESVIDSFDFDSPGDGKPIKWFCIDGGTSLVAQAMNSTIKGTVETGKRITRIALDRNIGTGNAADNTPNMIVQCAGESKPRDPYITVFTTTSLGCLQRVDLTKAELMPSQKDAIRSLHYDDSAKVALRFKYPWWIVHCGITKAGTANTDLPLRTCVYPSYNLHDGPSNPAILLCCYVWAQDANRIGSLIREDRPDTEEELLELIFRDLALLHAPHISLEKIKAAYDDTHHAFSWAHTSYTSGAFALFGPGQFANYFPYLSMPTADSKLHIVGEASSAHHAWIVGALNSAWCSVYRFLKRFGKEEYIKNSSLFGAIVTSWKAANTERPT